MDFRKFKAGLGLSACVLMMGAFAAPASADPFSSSLVASINPLSNNIGSTCDVGIPPFDCNGASSTNTAVSSSYSKSGPGFSVSGSAQADLATATLKVKGAATGNGQSPSIQSNATFSDGFKTTDTSTNSPFVWGNNSATFNLNLGNLNTLASSGDNNGEAFIMLAINTYGSTTADSNWFTGSATQQTFLYTFGPNADGTIGYGYQDPTTGTVDFQALQNNGEYFNTIPSTISATFTPGGDFDWVLLFGVFGQTGVSGGNFTGAPGSLNYDFSHTLTVDYQGPQGTTFASDSGVFGTRQEVAVPEPVSLSIFGAGLAGAAALRRRRRRAKKA